MRFRQVKFGYSASTAVTHCSTCFTGYPDPQRSVVYDESQTIDLDNVPLNGGFLIKAVALSIDPFMRSRMRDASIKQRFVRFSRDRVTAVKAC